MTARVFDEFKAASKALPGLPVRSMPAPNGIVLAILFILISAPMAQAAESDPLESVNRVTHHFNQVVDRWVMKPAAGTYNTATPGFLRQGIGNFFGNLDEVRVILNDVAQLKFGQAARDLGRLTINSTLGLGGLLDVADSEFGLEKNRQDFGKTLAHYGVNEGPYLVLPFFGPSTVRDAFGLGIDGIVEPVRQIDHTTTRNSMLLTEVVDYRANYLSLDDFIIGDHYLFLREAYLQQREFEVSGSLPDLAFEEF